MDPIAFTVPTPWTTLEIRWYGIMMATAMLVAAWIGARLLNKIGRNGEAVWDGLVWIILAGITGARFVYVVTNLGAYADNPWDVFAVWKGGLSFHGGIIGGAIATHYWFKTKGIKTMEVFDAFAPGVCVGIMLVRIGNFMNGDILGYKWQGPWALNFPHDEYHYGQPPGTVILRHPTEVYGFLVGLICSIVIFWVWRQIYVHKRFPRGASFLGFVIAYSLVRSAIEEPWRSVPLPIQIVDPATAGYGLLTTTQIVSILLILFGIWGLFQLKPWDKRDATHA